MYEKILKTGKGSGIYMKTMLWHKICEKSYKNKEKVAELIEKLKWNKIYKKVLRKRQR